MTIWHLLAIEPTTDLQEIKKAYAKQLKNYRPEEDSKGFQLLREAYERARQYAEGREVSFELFSEEETILEQETDLIITNAEENREEEQEEEFSLGARSLADLLIEELLKDEEEAIKLLEAMLENKGPLDNLEFSNDFQQFLAFGLLKIENRPDFIRFAIKAFDWENHSEKDDYHIFGASITNLINQIKNEQPRERKISRIITLVISSIIINFCVDYFHHYYKKKAIKPSTQMASMAVENSAYLITTFIETTNKEIFNGANNYRLHLDFKMLPLESWTLIIDPHNTSFDSPHRIILSTNKQLQYNQDGSIDIYIQQNSPGKAKENNWLKSHPGNFSLFSEYSWEKAKALNARWTPPLIEKIEV